jgi:hypothetical protein
MFFPKFAFSGGLTRAHNGNHPPCIHHKHHVQSVTIALALPREKMPSASPELCEGKYTYDRRIGIFNPETWVLHRSMRTLTAM